MPEPSISDNDGGDETASRYRYQYTLAAITCCAMFDKTQEVEEVYCERHEDILIKHTDGKFSGLQVKTRDVNQPVWKASDPQIKAAFRRFVHLDQNYPQTFRSFRFLTNHPLYVAERTTSLGYILKQVGQAKKPEQLPNLVKRWLCQLATGSNPSEIAIFRTLKKTTVSCSMPKLRDATIRLIQTLAECWDQASECSYEEIGKAARRLVEKCERASTLDHRQLLPAYLQALPNPEQNRRVRIDGKRMTMERVQLALRDGMMSTATLDGFPEFFPTPGQGCTDLLLAKLDAGGFSIVTCNSAKDLHNKAEFIAIASIKRFGRLKGRKRYDHMRSLVLNDASHAFEQTKDQGSKFGPAMRDALRIRFQIRRNKNEQLYDYSDEHMEGLAYSLTAQCKVHWSIDRPWETI